MFIIFALKILSAISISLGVFTNGDPQPGQVFHIAAVVAENQSQSLTTRIVLSSSLELVELHTSPPGMCQAASCVTPVDSSGELLVIAFIRAKQKAPIGLQSIQLDAFDDQGNTASSVKQIFIGTIVQPAPQLAPHRRSYFPIFKR